MDRAVTELLSSQSGVVSRRQLLDLGLKPHDVRRLLRNHALTRLFPGVFVNHTGEPTWIQRAWGAVLYAWPAALAGASAIRMIERTRLSDTAPEPVVVAIARKRTVKELPGVTIVRQSRLEQHSQWNASPPRMRYEEAVLDTALDARDEVDRVAALARACASRRTTAGRLGTALDERARVAGRAFIAGVLRDIADGTHSVLEHGYLTNVERPHGLPSIRRQLRQVVEGVLSYRDVDVGALVVELDGMIFHESPEQRDLDLERDLDVLIERRQTARLGWGQVYRRPCQTARKLGSLLNALGWEGAPVPCGPGCTVAPP